MSIVNAIAFIGEFTLSGTSGSVLYVDSNTALAQDNTNLFWDTANTRLRVANLLDSGLSASSPVYTDASKVLTSTAPTSGAIGYWSRSSTTLSPTTANDIVSIANTTTTGADLAITNTGVYTGTGIVNITANSATTGDIFNLSATGLTTGSAMVITGPSSTGVTDDLIKITSDIGSTKAMMRMLPDFSSSGGGVGLSVEATDSTTNTNTDTAAQFAISNTGNAAKTGYAIKAVANSSSTTADTLIAIDSRPEASGILTTGTRNLYGYNNTVTISGANTGGTSNAYGILAGGQVLNNNGGTINVYGGYFANSISQTTGTTKDYGVYISNGTGTGNGTTTRYGLYVEAITGGDTNYTGIFAGGLVGFGTTAPSYPVDMISSSTTLDRTLNVSHSGAISGSTGFAGVFQKTGASLTNIAIYGAASGATNNYGLYINSGIGYFASTVIAAGAVTFDGFTSHSGVGGAYQGNSINIQWNGSAGRLWVDTSDIGSIAIVSDERHKKNIESISSGLDLISQLRPVSFNWVDPEAGEEVQYGLIAQEVQKILPNLVRNTGLKTETTPDGLLQFDYNGLIAPLVRAVQELTARVEQLEAGVV